MDPLSDQPEKIRAEILDAAQQRFSQYGYNKTTMAEIAKDCGMSAANLYRYFENKLDIGAQLSRQCLGDKVSTLKSVVARHDLSAADRLKEFIHTAFQFTYEATARQPRINEMVEAVCVQKQPLVHEHIGRKRDLLVQLLRDGQSAGDFDVDDAMASADAILAAMTLFEIPILWHLYEREQLVKLAEDVTRLILRGVLKR